MKVLNPEAPAYVPGCAVAGKAGSVISDISAASAALAMKPAITKLVIVTPSDAADAALPTPNGLAELATCLSDNLTFEDMFDHGSRRGSVSISSNGLGRGLMAGTKQHAAVLRLAPAVAAACSSSGQPDVAVCPNANHQMQVLSSCTPASPD
jgi:hypothetical protein